MDGITNSPQTVCTKWCIEMSYPLAELVQFDTLRQRSAKAGDVWRVNFSRVQYELEVIVDEESSELCYEKVPDKREANIVWASTGVIDIHRPEKWGFVFFSSQNELPGGEDELASAMAEFLHEQIAMERILDTIYYDQREFYKRHEGFASRWEQLYPSPEAFKHMDLITKFELNTPTITCMSELGASSGSSDMGSATPPRRRSYVPSLDVDDDDDGIGLNDPVLGLLSPRSREIKRKEASGLFRTYTASVKSATQQWNIENDARLWRTK